MKLETAIRNLLYKVTYERHSKPERLASLLHLVVAKSCESMHYGDDAKRILQRLLINDDMVSHILPPKPRQRRRRDDNVAEM